MDTSSNYPTKVINPGLVFPIEPYKKEELFKNTMNYGQYINQCLTMSGMAIKNHLAGVTDETKYELEYLIRRDGHEIPDDLYLKVLAGNGAISICMNLFADNEHDRHDLVVFDHATSTVTPLGHLPLHGYYSNFGLVQRFGCCVREPGCLCQVTQDGEYVVLFGPKVFARPSSYANDAPTLLVYKINGAERLFKKNCKKISFLKCDPTSISICPVSIQQGHFKIAVVTGSMEIRFWDAKLEKGSILQLESMTACLFNQHQFQNPFQNCIKFSPDGHWLSVMGYIDSQATCSCVLVNTDNLEPITRIDFSESKMWLRFIFPLFSPCGTIITMSICEEREDVFDVSKYELSHYHVPIYDISLRNLCRVIILKHVNPDLLGKLPLPSDMIQFLVAGTKVLYGGISEGGIHRKQSKHKCGIL